MFSSLLLLVFSAFTSALPQDAWAWGPPGRPHGPPSSHPTHPAAAKPTVWLAGDSTMAPGGGGNGTEGMFRRFLVTVSALAEHSRGRIILTLCHNRMGSVPSLLTFHPRHQQRYRRPFSTLLHPRRSFRQFDRPCFARRFCGKSTQYIGMIQASSHSLRSSNLVTTTAPAVPTMAEATA